VTRAECIVKLVVGLGNPGARFHDTRHNLGFAAVDEISRRRGLGEWESAPQGIDALVTNWRAASTRLVKPLTYMNLSGNAIVRLVQFYKVEIPDLLVVVDDINLEIGRLRARRSGSAGGHNGLKSVIAQLGTEEFSRLRIGVGRGDERRDLADHVTGKIDPAERPVIDDAIGRAADAVETFITEGIVAVMNTFNRKDDKATESEET
jgi:PTH1 family peptidyl-tRNA hydrolase